MLQFVDVDIEAEIKTFVITKPVQPESEHRHVEAVAKLCIIESPAYLPSEKGYITVNNPIGPLHSLSKDWETDTKPYNIKALIQEQTSNHDIERKDVKPYIITSLVQSKSALWNGGRYDNSSSTTFPPHKVISLAQLQSENGDITVTNPIGQLHSFTEDLKTCTKQLLQVQALDQDIDIGDVKPCIAECLVQSHCAHWNRDIDVKPRTTGSPAQFQSENENFTTTMVVVNPLLQINSSDGTLKSDTNYFNNKPLAPVYTSDQNIEVKEVKPYINQSLMQANTAFLKHDSDVTAYTTQSPAQLESKFFHSEEYKFINNEFEKKYQRSRLPRHLLMHAGEKRYSCDECGKRFTKKCNLTRHILSHSGENKYTCDECGRSFTRKGNLSIHSLSHSGEQKYSCDECGKGFSEKSNLTRHIVSHTGKKEYSCDECGRSFALKGALSKHYLSHSGEKKYRCYECGKRFTENSSLMNHFLIHSGEKNYICHECGKRFATKNNLKIHLLYHSGEKKYSCDECGRRFSQKGNLTKHILSHSGEKKYNCDECGKMFTEKCSLKRHILIHSGGRTYSCDECGKRFIQKYNFTRHILSHLGEKKYKCNECGKGFTRKSSLKGHFFIHSGEKKYSCDECGKRFAEKSGLKRHLLIHSGEKKYSC